MTNPVSNHSEALHSAPTNIGSTNATIPSVPQQETLQSSGEEPHGYFGCISNIFDFIGGYFTWLYQCICGSSQSEDPTPPTTPSTPQLQNQYQYPLGSTQFILVRGNILQQRVDTIVNAANQPCLGGGGIDGAIHRAAGPNLVALCRELPEVSPGVRCLTGSAVITGGADLANSGINHVIHAVGPVYRANDPQVEQDLRGAYQKSLELAEENNIRTIAFPLLSGGIFGYPTNDASRVAFETINAFCLAHPNAFNEVRFVIIEPNKFAAAYQVINGLTQSN